ncbi:DNA topoisomerase IB [Aurantiacibacter gangjinensis]|uniref:DNA topoisomerase n=1 Tax=Aurantiacibacter gangjinensis TaxID=502682 RepID=A0A0G9MPH1_9SPHN|nr:DNA topoisomerase IB [Aurantiacibacter gangjinensis]APE28283.1 DNA topoisomerase IB (poxvirus type) [Aurantiacibacter gangjinensis]KLE32524.1 DNA topoisomerase [Aurantiacibacter gangjinensis]
MASRPSQLIYVDDDLPGITRKRAGKGWAYYDAQGALITDRAEKKRLNAIALPPAYTDAWFCPAHNGHILATGYDAAGRKQYRYHPEFRAWRESEKFDGCVAFGKMLPLVRKRYQQDMRSPKLGRDRAVAAVVKLLDLGAVRVGNTQYAKKNRSYGATTLQHRHAEVTGKTLRLRYTAKGGKKRDVKLSDSSLARVVRRMQDLNGQELFAWAGDDGEPCDVNSGHVNEYLREVMGENFSAKNFRTWHASVMAFRLLGEATEKLSIKAVLSQVAEHLGNTMAVTRKSYVHPAVIDLIGRQEEWRATLRLPRATAYANQWERGLLEHLETAPAAQELLAA